VDSEANKFFYKFPKQIFPAKKLILIADPEPENIYYLAEGFVRQVVNSAKGDELTIHIYAPGSYFPMSSVLNQQSNRYIFQSITDATIYLIPKKEIESFLRQNPDQLWRFTQRLSAGLEGLAQRIELLTVSNAAQRVASAIVFFAKHLGEENLKGLELTIRLTHREIATMAGLSRERTSLELEKLVQLDLIKNPNLL
jgi:CRP/FNR family transcriptional regulator